VPFYDALSGWKKLGDDIHQKDAAVFAYFWNRMKREIEQRVAPHSWGKGFVQSDYAKHGIDEMGAIYTAYPPFFPPPGPLVVADIPRALFSLTWFVVFLDWS